MWAEARRSQSAVVGAVIVALVLLAALGALFYEEKVYTLESQLSAERMQTLGLANELGADTRVVYLPSTYTNQTLISVNTTFPYAYEVYSIIGVTPKGPIIYGPQSVVGVNGKNTKLPVASSPGETLLINISGSDYSAVYLVLQSGQAVTTVQAQFGIPAPPSSSPPPSPSPPGPPPNTPVTINYLNGTTAEDPVVASIPIVVLNPPSASGTLQQGLQLNITINLQALENYLDSKFNGKSPLKGYGSLSAANIGFAVSQGNGSWALTDAWIEQFDQYHMHVWVVLPTSLSAGSNITLYLVILNSTDLGSQQLGVNGYYFGPGYDNIGYVMSQGVLYKYYVGDTTITDSLPGHGKEAITDAFDSCAGSQPQYSNGYWLGLSFGGLLSELYSAPWSSLSMTYTVPYLYCVAWPINQSGPTTMISESVLPIAGGVPKPVLFSSSGIPWVMQPSTIELTYYEATTYYAYDYNYEYTFQKDEMTAYSSLFNYWSSSPTGGPLSNASWLIKAVGWLSISNTAAAVGVYTDDGTYVYISSAPGHYELSNWLGTIPRAGSGTPLNPWAEDDPQVYNYDQELYSYSYNPWQGIYIGQGYWSWGYDAPVFNMTPVSSFGITRPGDYRVFIAYFNDIGTDSTLYVFTNSSYATWYAPQFPDTGQYPYLWSPVSGLLVGPTVNYDGYTWVVG